MPSIMLKQLLYWPIRTRWMCCQLEVFHVWCHVVITGVRWCERLWDLSASVINTNKVSHTPQPFIGCNAWLYFTVGQTVDRRDLLDRRESHWYRILVGVLRLLRPSKGIEAVSRAPQLPKNPLETRMIPAFPSILIMGCVDQVFIANYFCCKPILIGPIEQFIH